jgi:hypothetical protein
MRTLSDSELDVVSAGSGNGHGRGHGRGLSIRINDSFNRQTATATATATGGDVTVSGDVKALPHSTVNIYAGDATATASASNSIS